MTGIRKKATPEVTLRLEGSCATERTARQKEQEAIHHILSAEGHLFQETETVMDRLTEETQDTQNAEATVLEETMVKVAEATVQEEDMEMVETAMVPEDLQAGTSTREKEEETPMAVNREEVSEKEGLLPEGHSMTEEEEEPTTEEEDSAHRQENSGCAASRTAPH